MQTEQRIFKRFVPEERAYVVFRPEFAKLGRIKDISMGGLGYEYVIYEQMKHGTEGPHALEIDIFLSEKEFYLPSIACKVVYDIQIEQDTEDPVINTMGRRRCGLQFGDLSGRERGLLEFLLNNHVIGAA